MRVAELPARRFGLCLWKFQWVGENPTAHALLFLGIVKNLPAALFAWLRLK